MKADLARGEAIKVRGAQISISRVEECRLPGCDGKGDGHLRHCGKVHTIATDKYLAGVTPRRPLFPPLIHRAHVSARFRVSPG